MKLLLTRALEGVAAASGSMDAEENAMGVGAQHVSLGPVEHGDHWRRDGRQLHHGHRVGRRALHAAPAQPAAPNAGRRQHADTACTAAVRWRTTACTHRGDGVRSESGRRLPSAAQAPLLPALPREAHPDLTLTLAHGQQL